MPEGINEERVVPWMKERVPALEGKVTFSLIAGGHSNLTFKCEDESGCSYVLRRPPLGHVLESAHDMGREHKIIYALRDSEVPVPVTYGLCQDNEINGADFYIMDYVEGLVLNDSVSGARVPESNRRTLGLHVTDILCFEKSLKAIL